jgi:methionyl-tRNA synthetase
LRLLSVLLYPYMPDSAEQLSRQLGLSFDFTKPIPVDAYGWDAPFTSTAIHKGPGLFPRIESKPQGAKTVSDSPTPAQPATAPAAPAILPPTTATTPAPAAAPAQITIDEFMKVQLKTAKVLSAERVPKSEKLLKLQVSLGNEQRQIVAGIGKKYEPESLVGKTIVIVANLKPAKLMGIESQGMVLAAGDSDVRGLATILEEVDPGTKVK